MKELNQLHAAGICGSLRKGSFNMMLLDQVIKMSEAAGVKVEKHDLNTYQMPLYNYDIESAGMPDGVLRLSQALMPVDIVFIATPEHDYSITAALKNFFDWMTRFKPSPLSEKVAVIFGASTGPIGSLRGQLHLRHILTSANMHVLPQPQLYLANAESAFEADGSLKEKAAEETLRKLVQKSIEFAAKVR